MPLWGVEMKLDTFAVPFTADRRMAYAAAYLEQCSYRQVEEVQAADFVLLPVPAKDYMLEGLDGKTVFLGGGSYPGTLDYCKNENFAEKTVYSPPRAPCGWRKIIWRGHSTAAGCWCVAMGESVGYSPGCCWPTAPM